MILFIRGSLGHLTPREFVIQRQMSRSECVNTLPILEQELRCSSMFATVYRLSSSR
jgi:hypothetical protein